MEKHIASVFVLKGEDYHETLTRITRASNAWLALQIEQTATHDENLPFVSCELDLTEAQAEWVADSNRQTNVYTFDNPTRLARLEQTATSFGLFLGPDWARVKDGQKLIALSFGPLEPQLAKRLAKSFRPS